MSALPITLAEWRRNARETLRVQITEYQGCAVVDVRSWYVDGDGELRPGRSEITLSVRHLPELADATTKALALARERGCLNDYEPPRDRTAAERQRRRRAKRRDASRDDNRDASRDSNEEEKEALTS